MLLQVVRTLDVSVTVSPDPSDEGGQWPATATHYVITITYDEGPTYPYSGQLDPGTQGPIAHVFSGLPAGGSLTIMAGFYSDNDWLAGQGKTASMPAQPNQGSTLVVAFSIKENLVPLSSTTTYNFNKKLGFTGAKRTWLLAPSAPAPTATASDLDSSNDGNNLFLLSSLGLNEPLGALAYLWMASGQNVPIVGTGTEPYSGQLATFQVISDGPQPESELKFSGNGYLLRPCLAIPPATTANPVADAFLLAPDPSTSTLLLQALSLRPDQPFLPTPELAFGRFAGTVDDFAIHPAGYAVALNQATCTLQILKLSLQVPNAKAPVASIYAGQGTRPGLLYAPVALACSLDKILVLQTSPQYEQGLISAFDFKGNPVGCFASSQSITPLHPEGTASVVPLDLSIESKGYIYVLKYLQPEAGSVLPNDYRLDIYAPDGKLITQVAGLAAARLQVDLWRNLFTLNYEIVQGTGRTEPSVAQWIPSTPETAD